MRPSPAPLQRAPRPARPRGSRPSLATSQGTAPSLGFGAGSCCQRSAPAGSQPHCSILSRAPSSISFVLLLPVPGGCRPGRRSPRPPARPPLRQLVPRPRLCPHGRSPLLAPLVSREQLSVRERVRAGCSASGPVQFYCTGANRTEVGTIGGFLALPAPQREPWVGFSVGSFFFVLCFSPARAGVSPLGAPLPAFPRGPGSTFFKPRVFCLWVCILVALSDFCFIICSNRLWCQKH